MRTKKISEILSEINKKAKKPIEKTFACQQIDFDELFQKHALAICPKFQPTELSEKIKRYFVALSKGTVKKGLYIYGNVGTGKTTLFKIMNSLAREVHSTYGDSRIWFTSVTAPELVSEKMQSANKHYCGHFSYEALCKGKMYIDDLGIEPLCFNSYELLGRLLFDRHRNNAITFVSSNITPSEVLERYGPQVFDRLGEMFYLIKCEGNSIRE